MCIYTSHHTYLSIKACETSLEQQRIHFDGLEAAILNLQYFYQAIDKSYNSIGSDDDNDGDDDSDDDNNDYDNGDYDNGDDDDNDNDNYHDNIDDDIDSYAAFVVYYLSYLEYHVFK